MIALWTGGQGLTDTAQLAFSTYAVVRVVGDVIDCTSGLMISDRQAVVVPTLYLYTVHLVPYHDSCFHHIIYHITSYHIAVQQHSIDMFVCLLNE
jgi:hypothetical protein